MFNVVPRVTCRFFFEQLTGADIHGSSYLEPAFQTNDSAVLCCRLVPLFHASCCCCSGWGFLRCSSMSLIIENCLGITLGSMSPSSSCCCPTSIFTSVTLIEEMFLDSKHHSGLCETLTALLCSYKRRCAQAHRHEGIHL